jgi:drug/metabolite transporter (DMT)-like permease
VDPGRCLPSSLFIMGMSASPRAPHTEAPGWMVWTALWVVYLVWGSTYLAIRIVVETIPPFLAGGIRFTLAGLLMYLWLIARRGLSGSSASLKELGAAILVASLMLLGGNGLVMLAETEIPSALAALIVAAVPLWVVVLRTVTRDAVGAAVMGGTVAGFIGVAILVLPGGVSGDISTRGLVTIVAASFFWALGSFVSKKLTLPPDPITSTAVQMTAGGVILTVVGLLSGELDSMIWSDFSTDSLLALVYLVVAGSLLAFTAYTWLLQNAPISKVATYAYVNPVVAIFLGWLILNEAVTASIATGAAVIVASVAYIVRRETGPGPRPEIPEPALEPEVDAGAVRR